jgi:hypothetical protein
LGRKPIIPPALEEKLVQYPLLIERKYFGYTRDDVRRLAFQFDVRGSVHHSKIHKENPNKMQQCIKILLFHIYMKLIMFRATPPIIRSLKLHWQALVSHTRKVVGRVVGGHCQAQYCA